MRAFYTFGISLGAQGTGHGRVLIQHIVAPYREIKISYLYHWSHNRLYKL